MFNIIINYLIILHAIHVFSTEKSYIHRLENTQSKYAWDLINRIIPEKSHLFKTYFYYKKGNDEFHIDKHNGIIEISGTSGVAIAWGFNYYLKYYCNSHIGWQVNHINITDELQDVNIVVTAKDKYRYYQNVCTASYSFVWWNTNQWRQHIDWMALNGINLALAPYGQEAIWKKIFNSMNISNNEIDEYFTGPAFLSWERMGNIRGWGGPLSYSWHKHSINIQKFIINAMQSIGIQPALPAFAGFVPLAFKRLYPDAKLYSVEVWNNFESKYCCPLFLDPLDPLFKKLAQSFLTEITNEYGKSHIYYSDPFNEIKPVDDSVDFLKNVAVEIFNSMIAVDPKAIWLLQSWMFVHESVYWTPEKIKIFLTSVPLGNMLILDLQSEQWPQYEKFEFFYGQPFIWCMLHNFGGTLGMFGDLQTINEKIYEARNMTNSTLVGVGITPEGINQNFVLYDLLLETPLNNSPYNLSKWVENYADRRYGHSSDNIHTAWNMLSNSIYKFQGLNKMRGKYVITKRPNINIKPWSWYSDQDLVKILQLFLSVQDIMNDSDGYRHDLTDITRQLLQYRGDQLYISIMRAYGNKDLKEVIEYSDRLEDLFNDLELLLSSHEHFLLGNWLNSSKSIAENEQDLKLFEYNARNQITLWGPNGEIFDYACKQWGGLILDYYAPRWNIFLTELKESLKLNKKINMNVVKNKMMIMVEKPFTFSNKVYSTKPVGNCIKIAQEIFNKWSQEEKSMVPNNLIPNYQNEHGFKRLRREFHEINDDEDIVLNVINPNIVLIK